MTERIPVEKLFEEWKKDSKFAEAYEELAPYYAMLDAMLEAMKQSGINSQEELASRMGTSKQAVSRMLNARQIPSMRTLLKFAHATGTKPVLTFEPIRH